MGENFGLFKSFGDRLFEGETPTNLGLIGSFIADDADTVAFFNRVTAAGGSLTLTEKDAIAALVVQLKDAGLWTNMKAIYPMVGSSAAACAQNLKSASFTGAFSSGWTFSSLGVTPNGTSAYFDTTLVPFTQLLNNSAHTSFYLRNDLSLNGGYGVIKNDFTERMDVINFGSVLFSSIGTGGAAQCSTSVTPYRSLILGSRISSTSNKLYTAGVLRDTKTAVNTATLPTNNYWLGAVNQSSSFYSSSQCSFSSIGDGLNDTQAADLYTAVQAFQTTLSRQV